MPDLVGFIASVQRWVDDERIVREGLADEGAMMISRLMERMSLRSIAARTGLSPTYLSIVRNKHATISPGAYLRLASLWQEGSAGE